MARVLIIDDNEAVCTALQVLFELHGIDSATAFGPERGLAMVRGESFGAIIQDMNFQEDGVSGEEGVRLFHALRAVDPTVPILLITAWTSLETAIQLVKQGAHDYLGKPWDDEKLVREIKRLLAAPAHSDSFSVTGKAGVYRIGSLVYADPKMRRMVQTALRVAGSDAPILITGPNGSGKEMLAQLIQANSARKKRPFLMVNAGALPGDLIESELFGVEVGAYTGAQKNRIGRFEEADGGTLFLDEIGNLPVAGQIKLLRVLQSGEFSRLGDNRVRKADVRVISATNTNLVEAMSAGLFREDLYYRLNVVELAVPPLRERPTDIMPLADHFLDTLAQDGRHTLSDRAEKAMLHYDWPGNVRELRNLLQRALLISEHAVLTPEDLGLPESPRVAEVPPPAADDPERIEIERTLAIVDGNVSRAAEILGLSRQALYRRMEKHGIVWLRQPKA